MNDPYQELKKALRQINRALLKIRMTDLVIYVGALCSTLLLQYLITGKISRISAIWMAVYYFIEFAEENTVKLQKYAEPAVYAIIFFIVALVNTNPEFLELRIGININASDVYVAILIFLALDRFMKSVKKKNWFNRNEHTRACLKKDKDAA